MVNYEITFEKSRLDVRAIHAFLAETYWSPGIPVEVVRRAVENSLCIGALVEGDLAGFARVVTDRATFAYLADVFVLPEHRGNGLSRRLVEGLLAHPDLAGLRRVLLVTRDAHGLYAKLGFTGLVAPERFMERHDPDVYTPRGP